MKFDEDKSINSLIDSAMEKIKGIVDSSTIIGDAIITDSGKTIIPISKVSVGYVVGGGEYADLSARRVARHFPMAGGSSGGMSVAPVGFIVESEGEISFVNVENKTLYQTILNTFNAFISKINKENENENN